MRAQSQPRPEAALFVVVLELSSFAFSSSANRTILSCLWWVFFSLLFFFGWQQNGEPVGWQLDHLALSRGSERLCFIAAQAVVKKDGAANKQSLYSLVASKQVGECSKAGLECLTVVLSCLHIGAAVCPQRVHAIPCSARALSY